MYVLIGGGGQVGYYLARELMRQDHEVLLLDKDPARVAQLTLELGASVKRGDACEARTLDSVGCERADMVIAVTGDDEDNLVICQVAKERFGRDKTIARVNNPANEKLFQKLGIYITVSPTNSILHLIEAQIPHHKLVPLITLSRVGLGLVEVTIPADSPAMGKSIRSLDLPSSVNVALIVRGDTNITPEGDTIIESEDRLFALTTQDGEQVLRDRVLTEDNTPTDSLV
ncbi:MAG TPA: TrkA family potassium uptake protein [Ktedonobacterales bacterium]|jgi:trk system potassium uptake protein TrkA|nr:TrkA family potassium uptake protein [Ktedonobacterales bacterium]